MQVFICGMHRSGTSVVARLLNLMGLYFGPEGVGLPANIENPHGFWERRDVVALNDRLLASYGASWYDVAPFLARRRENDASNPVAPAVAAKVLDIDASRPWFVKDPRLCLTLPFWRRWAERAIVVLCWRDPVAVAASLACRSELADIAFSHDDARALWEAYYAEAVASSHGMARIIVRYEDVLADPIAACTELYESLRSFGAERLLLPPAAEVEAFVDRSLQRHCSLDGSEAATTEMRRLLHDKGVAPSGLSQTSREILERLHERITDRPMLARLSADEQRRFEAVVRSLPRIGSSWSLERLREFVDAATR